MNNVVISGNLGADPETKYTASGKKVTHGRLANNERWTDREGNKHEATTWVDFEVWGGWADALDSCSKGDQVVVYGKLALDEWVDASGQKRSKLKIKASEVYTTRKSGAPQEEPDMQPRQAIPQRQAPPQRHVQQSFTADL
jgi:single-strand DNA-binding protein